MSVKADRIVGVDIAKIVAMLFVVGVHVNGMGLCVSHSGGGDCALTCRLVVDDMRKYLRHGFGIYRRFQSFQVVKNCKSLGANGIYVLCCCLGYVFGCRGPSERV